MARFSVRKAQTTILFLLTLLLSLCLGWGFAQALEQPNPEQPNLTVPTSPEIGTVDVVPNSYKLGQDLYLESCATCHIALPPAVLPSQTWQSLLQDTEHYGTPIALPKNPNLKLIWNYLSTFSRPLREDEPTPFRIAQARHFKALHPQVKLPQSVTIATCATCHPKANLFNFRELSQEWR